MRERPLPAVLVFGAQQGDLSGLLVQPLHRLDLGRPVGQAVDRLGAADKHGDRLLAGVGGDQHAAVAGGPVAGDRSGDGQTAGEIPRRGEGGLSVDEVQGRAGLGEVPGDQRRVGRKLDGADRSLDGDRPVLRLDDPSVGGGTCGILVKGEALAAFVVQGKIPGRDREGLLGRQGHGDKEKSRDQQVFFHMAAS